LNHFIAYPFQKTFYRLVLKYLSHNLYDQDLYFLAALLFLLAAFVEAFFELLPGAFLLPDFFRAAMLSVLAFALESGVCKTADYT